VVIAQLASSDASKQSAYPSHLHDGISMVPSPQTKLGQASSSVPVAQSLTVSQRHEVGTTLPSPHANGASAHWSVQLATLLDVDPKQTNASRSVQVATA
jgi:hypothetical protein